jgi:branched-chain amino acid transport system ATP-binding protein
MSLLSLNHLTSWYGATQALFDVSLSLQPGEVLALMGRNGMGKTTTIKTICKMLPVKSGELTLDGKSLVKLPSFQVARMGVGLVPEGRRCFPNLTVEENLLAAAVPGDWNLQTVAQLFPRLAERRTQMANSLSGGEQQMLAIGRALMTNPRLLILDEATEGLAPIVRQEIWDAIRRLKQESELAILLVDKTLKELSQVADSAVVLEKGKTVWSGSMKELSDDVVQQFLGV